MKSFKNAAKRFSTTPSKEKVVQPQAETTAATSNNNVKIPTPATENGTAPPTPINASAVLDLIRQRRTYYALTKDLGTVTTDRVQEIVREAVRHVPSSFNSQTNRTVVLFAAEHDKFWDIVRDTLKKIVPEDKWQATNDRVSGFRGGAATILFFEDEEGVKGMQEKFAIYADKFPLWATQSDAMLQFTLWTALEAEGLGANLQHYNPLVDEQVAKEWDLPASWKLNAQLVVGGRAAEPGPKEFGPIEDRFKAFGA